MSLHQLTEQQQTMLDQHTTEIQQLQPMHSQQDHQSTTVTVVSGNGLGEPQQQIIIEGTSVDSENSVLISKDREVILEDVSPLPEYIGPSISAAVSSNQTSTFTPIEIQNLQMCWPQRMWTNDLTLKLLGKFQKRKVQLFNQSLRRRSLYAEIAEEFQLENIPFTTSDIEKKYTSLLSTYRRNLEKKSGSTWQYFKILDDLYSGVDEQGNKIPLPTSNLNPNISHPSLSVIEAASGASKPQIRQSKRMRTKPAKLKGALDYSSEVSHGGRSDSEFNSGETFDRVRELVNERLDELQTQREQVFIDSNKAWTDLQDRLAEMDKNIKSITSTVVLLSQTVSAVLNGLNKFKRPKENDSSEAFDSY